MRKEASFGATYLRVVIELLFALGTYFALGLAGQLDLPLWAITVLIVTADRLVEVVRCVGTAAKSGPRPQSSLNETICECCETKNVERDAPCDR